MVFLKPAKVRTRSWRGLKGGSAWDDVSDELVSIGERARGDETLGLFDEDII